MIGQLNLLNDIHNLISNERFPRFTIIYGAKGSGKKELCKHIAEEMNVFWCFEPDCKIETVRNVIWDAYKVYSPTMYIFTDADNMSVQAKNSLLKITEDPPNNAYIIMTLEDINNTLPTIRSRAASFQMDIYSIPQLIEYGKSINVPESQENIICELCETPGEIKYLLETGITEFYEYTQKVVENIARVNGANAFKIGSKLALKENNAGYDLKLFLKAFKCVCWTEYLNDKDPKYLKAIDLTSEMIQKCSNKSINKQMVFDSWILSIREEWM